MASFTIGAASRVFSGSQLFGAFDVYDYHYDLTSTLVLAAGTYYFSVNNAVGNWYWGVVSTTTGDFFVRDNLGPWDQRTSTLAFELQGTVAEPASAALLSLAFAGIALARRRRGVPAAG